MINKINRKSSYQEFLSSSTLNNFSTQKSFRWSLEGENLPANRTTWTTESFTRGKSQLECKRQRIFRSSSITAPLQFVLIGDIEVGDRGRGIEHIIAAHRMLPGRVSEKGLQVISKKRTSVLISTIEWVVYQVVACQASGMVLESSDMKMVKLRLLVARQL